MKSWVIGGWVALLLWNQNLAEFWSLQGGWTLIWRIICEVLKGFWHNKGLSNVSWLCGKCRQIEIYSQPADKDSFLWASQGNIFIFFFIFFRIDIIIWWSPPPPPTAPPLKKNSVIVAVKTLQRSDSIRTGCPKFSTRVLRGERTFWWFICQNTRRKIRI